MPVFHPTQLKSRLDVAFDLLRERGVKKFFLEILPWHFRRRYFLFSQSLEEIVSVSPVKFPFRLVKAEEKDISSILGLRPRFYKRDLIAKRLRGGHLCYLGWSGDKLVHLRWIFTSSLHIPYLRRTLLLHSGLVFSDEAFTAPGFRAKGLYAYAGYLLRLKLKDLGHKRLFLALASWDRGLQRVAARIGMEKTGEVRISGFFFLKKTRISGKVAAPNNGKTIVLTED